jgi:uncharacterized RDD family membrane protein YckC
MSDADYDAANGYTDLETFEPKWLWWVTPLTTFWLYSQPVVMLFNRPCRALHDFMAGTVVIRAQAKAETNPPK